MCWDDSKVQWAGDGLQNADEAEKRRRRTWWNGRRCTKVPVHEDHVLLTFIHYSLRCMSVIRDHGSTGQWHSLFEFRHISTWLMYEAADPPPPLSCFSRRHSWPTLRTDRARIKSLSINVSRSRPMRVVLSLTSLSTSSFGSPDRGFIVSASLSISRRCSVVSAKCELGPLRPVRSVVTCLIDSHRDRLLLLLLLLLI